MKKTNVMSLFNGMSFGMMALETLGVEVGNYYSSEIDKYANQATKALYPDIIQMGDVTKWREWDIDWSSIDLLLAGFPCQAWSIAGKQKGDNDPRGALVHDLIAIWKHINLKRYMAGKDPVKFMFENTRMKSSYLDYVNDLFGVKPIRINSALVSAQNRVRYYWTNIPGVNQPMDKEISLVSILENPMNMPPFIAYKQKSKCLRVGGGGSKLGDKHEWDSPLRLNKGMEITKGQFKYYNKIRFTTREMARLQTVPSGKINTLLNSGAPKTQLHKMLGNGWVHDVIVHILKGLK